MRHILIIFSIFLFGFIIISCGEDKEEYSATVTTDNTTTTTDSTAPVIAEVTKVTTPTNDPSPNYTFSSSEAGTITYGGSCSSVTTTATIGNNTITLVSLSEGTYSNCTITVTDTTGNVSNSLTITSFIVDTTAATLVEVTAIKTPANDSTPDYTFSSSEAGTITYGGSCYSSTNSATIDNNTITLNSLSDGTYSNCTISVEDNASNSVTLNMSSFVIETAAPTVTFNPANGATRVSLTTNITITFNEAIRNNDNSELTNSNIDSLITLKLTNSSGNNINFDATINSNKNVITIDPNDNLSRSQAMYVSIGATVEDTLDNTITAASATFTTISLGDTVGDSYGGGTVAYLLQSSESIQDISSNGASYTTINYDANTTHGFIVTSTYVGENQVWSNVTSGYTGANSADKTTGAAALGTGAANTGAIISQSSHSSSRAKDCVDHSATTSGTTYNDWYLPSLKELEKILTNREAIGGININQGSEDGYHWSSTEYYGMNNYVWIAHWTSPNGGYLDQSVGRKNHTFDTLCIRAF